MKNFLFLILALCIYRSSDAQYSRHIVRLTDKGSNTFSLSSPSAYLGPRALERRARHGISIDSTDLPVTARYIDSIRLAGNVTIINVSKWLNQVAIQTTDAAALTKISSFPFVAGISPVAARNITGIRQKFTDTAVTDAGIMQPEHARLQNFYQYGRSAAQVRLNRGDFLHNHGFRGTGIHMAFMDGGFRNYDLLPTFDSARSADRILGTWDFVAKESSVSEDHPHGTQCFSTVAANMPGVFVGTAPEASYYLFRTEDVSTEYPIEEQNWVVAAEMADSLGVDLCSTSLGYSIFDDPSMDYSYADMTGNKTISARGANIASAKGMLMVVSAGNEGNGSWRFVTTPGDGDSVLTIGAVDTLGNIANFSSYGPNSDGQVKPDVAAVGFRAIVANSNTGQPGFSSGTSFSCPNMAGITSCLWQAFPEVAPSVIKQTLRISSTRYSNPDDRTGYGIPDVMKAFVILQKAGFTSNSRASGCDYLFDFRVKLNESMSIDIERKTAADTAFRKIKSFQHTGTYGFAGFQHTDNLSALALQNISYRIRMNIAEDTSYLLDSFVYSAPECPAAEDGFSITPNPFRQQMTYQISSRVNTDIRLTIVNAAGQLVYNGRFSQPAGSLTRTLDVGTLGKGTYFVTAWFGNDKKITRKAVIR